MARARLLILFGLLGWLTIPAARAHEAHPVFVELIEVLPGEFEVTWKEPILGVPSPPQSTIRFPTGTIEVEKPSGWINAGFFLVQESRVRHPEGLAGKRLDFPDLPRTSTHAFVRIEHANGVIQNSRATPDHPHIVIDPTPEGWRVAFLYFRVGLEHILLGIDHLLFVLGLLLLVDRRWMLFKTVTAFTVAHSLTLLLATFAIVRVPEVPLNAAIALSILFLGPEIVRKWRGGTSLTIRHPWLVAFLFGLLHGIGFSSGLSLSGIPTAEIPHALLWFNIGVEAGQLAFVALVLALAWAVRTLQLDRPAWVGRIPGYAVGSFGAYWTLQRVAVLLAPLWW